MIEIEDKEDMMKNERTYCNVEERLKSLQNLYEQRLITKEEYDQKKQGILKDL